MIIGTSKDLNLHLPWWFALKLVDSVHDPIWTPSPHLLRVNIDLVSLFDDPGIQSLAFHTNMLI
jgi:hypothetical protein